MFTSSPILLEGIGIITLWEDTRLVVRKQEEVAIKQLAMEFMINNGQNDLGTIINPHFTHFVSSERNLESHEVLPASTYTLKKQDAIPDASFKLQLNQADLSTSSEIGANNSDNIGPVTVRPSLSHLLKDSCFDYDIRINI